MPITPLSPLNADELTGHSLLSIPTGAKPDNILHLVVALATLIFGSGLLSALGGRQPAAA